MKNGKFDAWCEEATARIRYWRDREAVSAELRAHLEDKYDALVAGGTPPVEAAARALESMGSPREIAPQLGAIHSPWLGWLYSFVRLVGITVLALAVVMGYYSVFDQWVRFSVMTEPTGLYSAVRTPEDIAYYDTPDVQTRLEGYCLRVTEVAVVPEDSLFHASQLHVMVEVTWWPWMWPLDVQDEIWALDSLGTCYSSYDVNGVKGTPRIAFAGGHYGLPGKSIWYFTIANFDCDSQWVELRYDREGRDMVLRVDLDGGGAE